ncbi:MAG TPA: extracellular solute-binding protein [Firmicutes bacterium]|nr:extracellular solute-binding protein [Bacillota bacterium]
MTRRCLKISWITLSVVLLSLGLFMAPLGAAANTLVFMGPSNLFQPELQMAFDNFEKRTGIKVEPMSLANWNQLNDKLLTMIAAGIPPDVVYGDDIRIFSYAEQNMLEPIDSFIARDNLNMNLYPRPVVEGIRIRGKIYSLPTAVSINGVYYHADIFARYGQSELPTDWSSNEFLWEDFVNLVKRLTIDTDGDGKPNIWGMQSFGTYGGFDMIGLWNVTDCDRERTRYTGTDPKVINALNQIMSLYTQNQVTGGVVVQNTAATLTLHSWYLTNMKNQMDAGNRINWKVGVLPKAEVRVSQGAFLSMAIPKGGANKEDAWKLVRYLAYEPEGAMLFTRAENRTPVHRDTMRNYVDYWNSIAPNANVHVFADATQVIWRWNLVCGFGGTEISNHLNKAFQKIRSGETPVQAAIAEIAPSIQAILDDSRRQATN